jgi:single-strand DNA-binding protein
MSRSVNKVILIGHLGKDPEVKFTPSGMPVAKFSIATSDRHKDKDGNWQERTEWHNLVAFQRTAEIIGEYCKKGSQIFVEGKLSTSSWDDKETGQKKYKTEVIINELVLLGGRGGAGGGGGQGGFDQSRRESGGNNMDQRAPEEHASQAAGITDDDIPF